MSDLKELMIDLTRRQATYLSTAKDLPRVALKTQKGWRNKDQDSCIFPLT